MKHSFEEYVLALRARSHQDSYRAQARMYLFSRPPLACTHSALAPTVREKSYLLSIQRCNRTNAWLYVIVKRSSRTVAAQRGTPVRTQCHFTDFVALLSHFVHCRCSMTAERDARIDCGSCSRCVASVLPCLCMCMSNCTPLPTMQGSR